MAVTPGQGRWPSLELEQLLEETHDAVVALDADLRFRFVNRRAARILRREPEELVGTGLADAFPRAAGQPFLESWAEALERRQPVSRSAFYEPLEGWFETRAVPAGQGLVVFARDITAGKQAEAELGRSERRHRVLTHQLGDMVWLVDPEGRPVKAADWAAAIGQDVAPATDADWNDIVHPDDQAAVQAAWTTSLQTGRAFDHTMRMRSGDGRWLHIRSRAVPVRGAAGIEEWIGVNEDLTDQVEAEAALRRAASVDPLTGLPNRGQFVERLASAVARRAPRTAVLYVDLDRFKAINDHFGHAAGDALICAVAERLTATVRPSDVVSRLSGDEFAVICDELDSEEEAATIAARILEAIGRPLEHDHRIQGSASIGVSFVGDHAAEDAEAVLRAADAAMYRAKARGGAAVEVFDERLREVLRRRSIVDAELRAGIDAGAVQLAFQPIVPLGAGRPVSLEALLRWQRPGGPSIPAYEAVSVAEQNGLIGRIGREVLRLACAQAAAWCAEGRDLSVAVNLSPRQLARPEELLDDVAAALRDAGLPPERLVLEITENVLMEGSSEEVVDALRALGIALEIDDFGVGYSSLSYLHRLPVQAVKLDRSFVSGLPADRASARILDAVVGLGRAFDIGVIAEGVETPEQLEAVQAAGCDAVQGFCLARPAPPHEVPAALADAARACRPSSASESPDRSQ